MFDRARSFEVPKLRHICIKVLLIPTCGRASLCPSMLTSGNHLYHLWLSFRQLLTRKLFWLNLCKQDPNLNSNSEWCYLCNSPQKSLDNWRGKSLEQYQNIALIFQESCRIGYPFEGLKTLMLKLLTSGFYSTPISLRSSDQNRDPLTLFMDSL